ncbi:MAG: GAF domain-containing protein [Acidobacteriota bacterium]
MSESIELAAPEDDKPARYAELLPQLRALVDGEPDLVANLANITAALRVCLPVASWVGFYVRRPKRSAAADAGEREDELVLGPFQGKVACVRIALGRGVCGTAAAERRTVIVADVDQFPGHIACDAGSRSEIVVPIVRDGRVVAVLDVDSYELAAFDAEDARGLEQVAQLAATLDWE